LADIHVLSMYAHEGIEGVITGRALYEGRLDLAAAIEMGQKAEGTQ
ncbi:MAG: 1-(5-phosphoribosyl)-5-((5-phosphoribosylamino)methylideneamino)imidazole-4-carboxamide isomerase, partial [Erythrobacter sp.]